MIILTLFLIQILLESSSDACFYKVKWPNKFKFKKHNEFAHFFKGIEVIIWILFAKYSCEYFIQWRLYDDWKMEWFCFLQMIIAYSCIRFGIFNLSFNLQTRQSYDHIGTGNWTDEFMGNFIPFFNIWTFRLFIFACGIIDTLHLTNVLFYN
jgi:hypothetical protein